MEIYFLRHGEQARKESRIEDSARPLTEEGRARMEAEARAIAALGLGVRTIMTSPYLRARQTAEIVASNLGLAAIVEKRLAPGFGADQLSEILSEAPEAPLMLVGHEPDFSRTIAACIGGGAIELKTGGLARVETQQPGSTHGTLAWLIPSRVLAR